MKKGKSMRITIEKEELMKQDKRIRRERQMELGVYNLHKNKTMRSKKDFNRKSKHKVRYV